MILQPKHARKIYIWHVAVHLLALLVILLAPIALSYKSLLLLLWSLHGYFTYRQLRKGSGKQVVMARILTDGRSRLTMGDGRKLLARVRHDTLVTPWLVLLRFDLDRGWFHPTLILTPETLGEDEMRQLCVLIRFSRFENRRYQG
jgi:hypothetical protein